MVEVTAVKDPGLELELKLELEIVPEKVPVEPVVVSVLVQGRLERVEMLLVEIVESLTGEVPVLWTRLELAAEVGLVERDVRHGVRDGAELRTALELGTEVGIITAELLDTILEREIEIGIMTAELLGRVLELPRLRL